MTQVSILALTKSTGGLSHYNRMLLGRLDPDRFRSHTICLSEGGEGYAATLSGAGLSAEHLPMARYSLDPMGDLRVLRVVLREVRRRRPDVILCHGSKAGVIGRAVGCMTRTPAVYCQASLPFLPRVQGGKAKVYLGLELAARALGGNVVALTRAARDITVGHRICPPGRIDVISTGIDTERFRPSGQRDAIVAEFGLDPGRPVVGWMGRFEPQKAPADFLAAVEITARLHPEVQFVLAGEGALKAAVTARVVASGIADRVRVLPWQEDPARAFAGFDIYALSSRWEGLPLTLLEAMAAGCAPVSTDVDGCAEAIDPGRSGLIVPAADPAAFAAALGTLIADAGLRAEMARAARERIVAQFEVSQMTARWASLLERLASRQPADVGLQELGA